MPLRAATTTRYDVKKPYRVVLKAYNLLGAEVAVLLDKDSQADVYEVKFNGEDIALGIYFCQVEMGDFQAVRKMAVLK